MPNTHNITLLIVEELEALYACPRLSEPECNEYFTFTDGKIKVLQSFTGASEAEHFATSLVFFKLKYTLINFIYRDVIQERQHIMSRYFAGKPTPRELPNKKAKIRVENKVLSTIGFMRFRGDTIESVANAL